MAVFFKPEFTGKRVRKMRLQRMLHGGNSNTGRFNHTAAGHRFREYVHYPWGKALQTRFGVFHILVG